MPKIAHITCYRFGFIKLNIIMKIVTKIFSAICFILLSIAYFLWIYEQEGFIFSVRCFFVWGFALCSYTVILWTFSLITDDFY